MLREDREQDLRKPRTGERRRPKRAAHGKIPHLFDLGGKGGGGGHLTQIGLFPPRTSEDVVGSSRKNSDTSEMELLADTH